MIRWVAATISSNRGENYSIGMSAARLKTYDISHYMQVPSTKYQQSKFYFYKKMMKPLWEDNIIMNLQ